MNKTITLQAPEHADFIKQGTAVITKANSFEIDDAASYQAAGTFAVDLKNHIKEIDERFDPVCKAAFDAHRGMTRMRDDAKSSFVTAQQIVTRKQRAYREEEERRARAEESRILELQRKEAEKLRAREVKKLEKVGDIELADALKDAPVTVAPVVVPREIPKVTGQTIKKNWKYRIVNMDLIPREYLIVDEKKLGAYARAMKATAKVAGVEFYSEDTGF